MNPPRRPLGRSGLALAPVGFGAVKIGRREGLKHPTPHDLPGDDACERLLHGVLDMGINLIDTAPAYGASEQRIGRFLAGRRSEFVLSTKVGETFDQGRSRHDFSAAAVRDSLARSLDRLRTDRVDITLIHSDGRDLEIMQRSGCVEALLDLRAQGLTRLVGLSGKTVEGARAALAWADVVMIPFNTTDTDHAAIPEEARAAGVGVLVKKALASGRLPPDEALRFALAPDAVSCAVVGSLSLDHIRDNLAAARA